MVGRSDSPVARVPALSTRDEWRCNDGKQCGMQLGLHDCANFVTSQQPGCVPPKFVAVLVTVPIQLSCTGPRSRQPLAVSSLGQASMRQPPRARKKRMKGAPASPSS